MSTVGVYTPKSESARRSRLFDDWSVGCEASVRACEGFPLEGYDQVLDEVALLADAKPGMTVLDLGIGAGLLAARFVARGCRVWGLDDSPEVLAAARLKLPHVDLARGDLLGAWPPQVERRFDRVVSAYAFHQLGLDAKLELLGRLTARHLNGRGRILIGDISFLSTGAREEQRSRWRELWDERQHYWAAEEASRLLERRGLRSTYRQVSFCAGVYMIEPAVGG